ncbi:class I SAM-dependent methyltransferase [Clostridium brassicae]|uniref:Class I SAM-dependent methyltransferase n=1 Tax=Clostridium brassicae TaxID=2999072 RepID=A0ABT4DCS8_9CLOT|nr:class I SAM-dependent methyltransferase [Clostridium brassicae]MCY6960120.1 class I SAM-dependent methyltransferase [Clostridium brassicae]
MDFNDIFKFIKQPKVFEPGTSNFWHDSYISKNMLEAHLNPDWDAASRKPKTIDKTVAWINDNFLQDYSTILDLGCGPGLYAERLARLGYHVTGIDFSKRSIEYAKESDRKQELNIEYIYQNYLEIDYDEKFDVAILIYCDFGVLSNEDRAVLLQKVYKALKPGGFFIFDVFTEDFKKDKIIEKNWYTSQKDFWGNENHIVLSEVFHYPEEKVFLDQNIVLLDSNRFDVYRSYNHYYSEDDLTHLLDEHRYRNHHFFYGIIGDNNFISNSVVFTVTQK